MKISAARLRQIIKEEVNQFVVQEQGSLSTVATLTSSKSLMADTKTILELVNSYAGRLNHQEMDAVQSHIDAIKTLLGTKQK